MAIMDHFKIVKHCLLISEIEITIFKIVDYWLQFMDQVSGMGKELKQNPLTKFIEDMLQIQCELNGKLIRV